MTKVIIILMSNIFSLLILSLNSFKIIQSYTLYLWKQFIEYIFLRSRYLKTFVSFAYQIGLFLKPWALVNGCVVYINFHLFFFDIKNITKQMWILSSIVYISWDGFILLTLFSRTPRNTWCDVHDKEWKDRTRTISRRVNGCVTNEHILQCKSTRN